MVLLRIASVHDVQVDAILLDSVQELRIIEQLDFTLQSVRQDKVSSPTIWFNSDPLNESFLDTLEELRIADIT